MLLAIDAGNTNVSFSLFDDAGRPKGAWRTATDTTRTSDEYAVWLTHLMALRGFKPLDITQAILASVVPRATFNISRLCRDHFGCEPMVIGDAEVDLGIPVLLDAPDEVGADRLVNAVGALTRHTPPLIIIDFGTATTFDIVDADGAYIGGAIAPGITLSVDALHMAAAKLPRIDIDAPDQVIGKSTIGAMKSGIFWGYVGLIEGLVDRIKSEFGAPMKVLATGGLSPLFAERTDVIEATDEELTMKGLLAIHARNRRL